MGLETLLVCLHESVASALFHGCVSCSLGGSVTACVNVQELWAGGICLKGPLHVPSVLPFLSFPEPVQVNVVLCLFCCCLIRFELRMVSRRSLSAAVTLCSSCVCVLHIGFSDQRAERISKQAREKGRKAERDLVPVSVGVLCI